MQELKSNLSVYCVGNLIEVIDKRMLELAGSFDNPNFEEACKYTMQLPGKRIRARIVIGIGKAYGIEIEKCLDAACALEYIHTYSLIHDDLPAMDDDDMRRGKPSLHKVYGEGIAILVGDFLQARAFEILSQIENLSSETKLTLIQILANKAGTEGMVGGQALDLQNSGLSPDLNVILALHKKKTAALISAAFMFGAAIAHKSLEIIDSLEDIGSLLGTAFQIKDDLLDISETLTDKPKFSDLKNKKPSILTVLSKEAANNHIEKLTSLAIEKLKKIKTTSDEIFNIFDISFDEEGSYIVALETKKH